MFKHCRLLVSIDTNVIRLRHSAGREYVASDIILSKYQQTAAQVHKEPARVCLRAFAIDRYYLKVAILLCVVYIHEIRTKHSTTLANYAVK